MIFTEHQKNTKNTKQSHGEIKMKNLYEEAKARLLEAKAKGLLNVHPIVLVVKSGKGDVPLMCCHRDKNIPARL